MHTYSLFSHMTLLSTSSLEWVCAKCGFNIIDRLINRFKDLLGVHTKRSLVFL